MNSEEIKRVGLGVMSYLDSNTETPAEALCILSVLQGEYHYRIILKILKKEGVKE